MRDWYFPSESLQTKYHISYSQPASLTASVSCAGNIYATVLMFLMNFYSYNFFVNTFLPSKKSLQLHSAITDDLTWL